MTKTKTRNKTKRNNKKKTQNKRRKSLFYRKVVGGDPTVTKQIIPIIKYDVMVIPNEDTSGKPNEESISFIIDKNFLTHLNKSRKSQHSQKRTFVQVPILKDEFILLQPDKLTTLAYDPLSGKNLDMYTRIKNCILTPEQIVTGGIQQIYYQLIMNKPYLIKIGKYKNSDEDSITFLKEKIDKGIHIYNSIVTINTPDIRNYKVLLVNEKCAGLLNHLISIQKIDDIELFISRIEQDLSKTISKQQTKLLRAKIRKSKKGTELVTDSALIYPKESLVMSSSLPQFKTTNPFGFEKKDKPKSLPGKINNLDYTTNESTGSTNSSSGLLSFNRTLSNLKESNNSPSSLLSDGSINVSLRSVKSNIEH